MWGPPHPGVGEPLFPAPGAGLGGHGWDTLSTGSHGLCS